MSSERNTPEYKKWKAAVKKRDGRYCQWPECRKRGKEVHHIIPWSKNPSLRYAPENGIYLCVGHHSKVKSRENDYVGLFLGIVQKNQQKNKK